MITFLDLIQKDDFRDFVQKRIANGSGNNYYFPCGFPKLYKYRSLSEYAVDDIVNRKLSLSSIGTFNDAFDGSIHLYGTKEEREKAAGEKWAEMEALRVNARIPKGILKRDSFVRSFQNQLKLESRMKFRELDYLGTYVYCFSEDNTSTLMWSHYADSNKGICIEYNFDILPSDNLIRNSIFPIAYTKNPISVSDLIEDENHIIYQYPIDAAVLCSALNKAQIWSYEREWRFVWVTATSNENLRWLPIKLPIAPSKVYLGYHFLKPFFFHEKSEEKKCIDAIQRFMKLIDFLKSNQIPVAIMLPSVGSYAFKPFDLSVNALTLFMNKNFAKNAPNSIRFYYTLHDHLLDIIEKEQEPSDV